MNKDVAYARNTESRCKDEQQELRELPFDVEEGNCLYNDEDTNEFYIEVGVDEIFFETAKAPSRNELKDNARLNTVNAC